MGGFLPSIGYAAVRISSRLNGRTNKFAWLRVRLEGSGGSSDSYCY
jgi:hypothetical protein